MILDEVRIWNRARTPAEVFATFDRELAPAEIADSSLVAYWPLDEGGGQVAPDATTGHGHDLTLDRAATPSPTIHPGQGPRNHRAEPGSTMLAPDSAQAYGMPQALT